MPPSPAFSNATSVYHTAPSGESSPADSDGSFRTAVTNIRPGPVRQRRTNPTNTAKPSRSQVTLNTASVAAEETGTPRKRRRDSISPHLEDETVPSPLRQPNVIAHEQDNQTIAKSIRNKRSRPKLSREEPSTGSTEDGQVRQPSQPRRRTSPVVLVPPRKHPSTPRASEINISEALHPTSEEVPIQSVEMPPHTTTISTADNIPPVSQRYSLSTSLAGQQNALRSRGDSIETREAQQAQLALIFRQQQEEGERRRQQKLEAVNRFNEAFIRESSREKSQSVERSTSRRPSVPSVDPRYSHSYSASRGTTNFAASPRAAQLQPSYHRTLHTAAALPSPPLSYTTEQQASRGTYNTAPALSSAPAQVQRKRASSPKGYYYTSTAPNTTSVAPQPSPRMSSTRTTKPGSDRRGSSRSSKKMYSGASGPVYSQDILGIDSSKTRTGSSSAPRPLTRVRMFG
ncbi:MAG: hypothetical protein M1828_000156 [Chrysothrix sp. TS-e1954]|nr:MAG: hypothetical protein M1828_000156 [Chrysothrix sp. TS-e1954]